MSVKFSVIIPNWNGKDLLRKNLLPVLKSLPGKSELIIIDNGSTDGSVEYVKQLTISSLRVKLVENKENLGFVKACNQGAKVAKGEFLVLLNNDVLPEPNFLEKAVRHFENNKVFAVSFCEVGSKWGSWAKIFWKNGFFNYFPGEKILTAHISGWASGGSAIFRKSMWLKLGGLDPIYEPFYWEDLDLSYRAWKRGWKIIWESEAKVSHKHASTISRFDRWYVAQVRERNQLLFIWKNIADPVLLTTHFFGLIFRVLSGPNYIKVIFSALKRYLAFGRPKIKDSKLSDKEVFSLFNE